MKHILTALVIGVMASATALADAADDKKAFREAYKAYQEAAKGPNWALTREKAKEAYELGEKLYGPDHKNTATLLLNYGRLIQNDEKALPILRDAVSRYEKLYGNDAIELIDPLLDLAASSTDYGTLDKAKSIYRRALKLAELHYPDDPFVEGSIVLEMGKVALQEAQSSEALRHLRHARKIFDSQTDPSASNKLAETNFYLGKFLLADKKYKRATEALLTSLEIFEKNAPDSRVTMTNHAFLIEAYEKRGLRDEATKHCQAIGSKSPQDANQDYMPVYMTQPVYPISAQRSGKEGYAIIEVTVDANGFVQNPVAIDVDGHPSFEATSIEAVQKFRYAPRYENGRPVETDGVRYRFSYNLRK